MFGFIGDPKKAVSKMKKTFSTLAAAQRAKKPVGTAKPVGGVGTTGFKSGKGAVDSSMLKGGPAGGMAKMPTTGGAARRPGMGRVQKPMMKKGGAVKKAAAKKGKK